MFIFVVRKGSDGVVSLSSLVLQERLSLLRFFSEYKPQKNREGTRKQKMEGKKTRN